MKPFPDRKYNIIYADPPWSYKDKAHAGQRGVEYKYPTMKLSDIKALPVQDIAADDCVLFMWTTAPQMEAALEVIKAWGFEYVTRGFVWVKRNKKADTIFWGGGHWTRANPEDVLIARVGKPKRISASIHSVVTTRIREHSRKPDEIRDLIVSLMGDLPRIELFTRQRFPGWDAWGNEVDKFDAPELLDVVKSLYDAQNWKNWR